MSKKPKKTAEKTAEKTAAHTTSRVAGAEPCKNRDKTSGNGLERRYCRADR